MKHLTLAVLAALVTLTHASQSMAQTASPIATLKALVVQTVQACRDDQEGKALLFTSAHQLGYGGSFAFGFFREVEGQRVKLEIQQDGCRLTLLASPAPFGETVEALIDQTRTWSRPQTVYDNRRPTTNDGRTTLRTFIGWQSEDRKQSELLFIDEPDPASGTSRSDYMIAYGWFTQ